MRLNITGLSFFLLLLAFGREAQERPAQGLAPATLEQTCAPLGSVRTRTTLYFGLSKPGGSVTETEWLAFLHREVTPRFPEGLTVWQADGQWREPNGKIGRERAKVLLLVHEQSPELRPAIAAIVRAYKRSFVQESVLWETAPVCAAF
jgi:Protein of unknown function (DUF3574)